jgi:SAM-dependent methyltransferase
LTPNSEKVYRRLDVSYRVLLGKRFRGSNVSWIEATVDLCTHDVTIGGGVIETAQQAGVDPAPVMLRVARILTRPSETVCYATGRAESLPLPDGSASVLWTIASVHHWADLDAGLDEAKRVLSPVGRLVAIERRTWAGARGHASHGWTDEQATAFADLCHEHGFIQAEIARHQDGRRTTLSVTARIPPAN